MTGAELAIAAKVAVPATRAGLRVVEQYVGIGLRRRYKKRLGRVFVAALVANADAPPEAPKGGLFDRLVNSAAKPVNVIRRRRGLKRAARKAAAGKDLETPLPVAADDQAAAPNWQARLASDLSALAERERQAYEPDWLELIGERDSYSWARSVASDFAMRIRADPKLDFVVAQLKEDDEQGRFALMLQTARDFVFLGGIAMLGSAAMVAAAIVLD